MNTTNTIAEITATEIKTVESLVAEARRRGFKLHGGFHPPQLIPMVEAAIAEHNTRERGFTETSGEYIEWKQTMDNLQEFLAILNTLPERLPYESAIRTSTTAATTPTSLPSDDDDEDENDLDDEDNDDCSDTETLIEKVEKYLAENARSVRSPQSQQHTTRRTPVADPLDTRRTPVEDASENASDQTSSVSPKTSVPSKADRHRAEYLAELMRESAGSKSPIDDFPPERQRALYRAVREIPLSVVVKMIGAPEPLGWGFKTSDTSLKRFKNRYEKKLEAAELAGALAQAEETIQQTGASEQAYTDAARRLLKIRLYRNAADPEGCDEELDLLMRLLDRQRRTDLAERRVCVTEQRAMNENSK